ncbi:MAG: hypothetical protein HYU51_03025 [Candidatus Rokubacteria bacterium]|nr:hypothetical protein [Candidatus Rokubacteria bacterium]
MIPSRWFPPCLALLAVCLAVAPVSAQFPAGRRPAAGARRLQQPVRAPVTLTPSVTVTEEYNDNVLLNNDVRRWDLITSITPALTLAAEQPTWRINAAYDFSTRLYARDPDRNRAFDRQNFDLESSYQVDPMLGLSLADSFSLDTGINVFSPEGIATGRDRAWSNSIRPAASFRLDRLTTLRGGGAWTVTRFERAGLRDSDTWGADATVDRALTPRLRGTLGYEFGLFDIETVPDVTTHTPRVGLTYEFTPTISGTLSGGPTFEQREDGDDRVTPAIAASLAQRFIWGAVTLSYDRAVGTAGGLGGTTDNQSAGAGVAVTTLLRGLTIEFAPRYRTFKSDDAAIGHIDVVSVSLPLQATYQITPWFGLTAGYAFFRQRADTNVVSTTTPATLGNDVDQNRVFFGLQVGYPIRFD